MIQTIQHEIYKDEIDRLTSSKRLLDTSSFINALRRFLALRGPAMQFHSDCGTNFFGARNEIQSCLKEMDDSSN